MEAMDLLFRILLKKAFGGAVGAEPVQPEWESPWLRCPYCGLTYPSDRSRDGGCPTCFWERERRLRKPTESPGAIALREAYEKLGCGPGDPDGVVQSKYREIAKICHPDRVDPASKRDAEELFRELTDARDLIMDSRK